MYLGAYAVKDVRSGFLTPTFEQNDQVAMRNFGNAVMQVGTVLNNFPKDFELWKVGVYDTETAKLHTKLSEDVYNIDPEERFVYKVCEAVDFIKE